MPAQATAREHAGPAGRVVDGAAAQEARADATAADAAATAQATANATAKATAKANGKTVDAADYRRVLGHFPSGVTVVASEDADGPVGFACQAFSALSLDPPLVLFSVGRTSTTWPRIEATGRFCVNFLADDHEDLCRAFAVSGGDKFAGVDWRRSELGSPILAGAHGWVDCTIEATHPGGDHTIVVGRVHGLDADGGSNPLIFHKGAFG